MTPLTIAHKLLEAEPDDLDAGAEIKRFTTSQFPGYDIDREGDHWNVYKEWRGSQHYIGEIHFVDMATAPVEIMSPEARAHHEAHRWVSIAGFRQSEQTECKTFEQAVQWIIAVNAAKTAPVRETRVSTMYHVASREDRESILRHGLNHRLHFKGVPKPKNTRDVTYAPRGIYFSERLPDAIAYAEDRDMDIWKVNVTGLNLKPDEAWHRGWFTRQIISPDRLRLLGPVAEALDPDDPEANIEKFAQERSVPVQMEIANSQGRRFRVQILWDYESGGIAYDEQGKEVPGRPEPTVEFYDMTYAHDPKYAKTSFKDQGQFVSRYHAATLMERYPGTGLDLHGGEPVWQIDGRTMDKIIAWVQREVEGRGFKLNKEGGRYLWHYEGIDDPDDPEPYLHPEKFSGQPTDEKIEGALRRMLAPYYPQVSINKRPGLFAKHNRPSFADNFIWTIHCKRDTPLPLSIVNRNMPGYDLDWRQEVKHWFEKWASRAGLSLLKFEIYGRLRKDPTFQFETARLGPLKENDELSPEAFLQRHVEWQDMDQRLVEALWKFHPYGVGYNAMVGPRFALITVQTYFPPEKDNFIGRFRDFVVKWLTDNRIMTVNSDKLTAGGGHEKDYPRWSIFLAVNMDWPPDEPAYQPPTVDPGASAPVKVGQP